jgi:LPS-assembly protein
VHLCAFLCFASIFDATILHAQNIQLDKIVKNPKGEQKVFLEADNVEYDISAKKYIASGNVEIVYETRRVTADIIEYYEQIEQVWAKGNVELRDETEGNTQSNVFADEIRLDTTLSDGFAKSVGARIGKQIKIAAKSVNRLSKNKTQYTDAVYTPCNLCKGEKNPLWQVRAKTMTDDNKAKMISYENPSFEIYGLPVLALPYFEHASPDVKRKSGFLFPKLESDSDDGLGFSLPYFQVLSPSQDLTFEPTIYFSQAPLLQGEYRERFRDGEYSLYLAGTVSSKVDNDTTNDREETTRTAVFGKARFKASDNVSWGADIQRASDETFLNRYSISGAYRLQSRAFWDYNDKNLDVSVNSFAFQGLQQTDNNDFEPFVLPYIDAAYRFDEKILGGSVDINGNLMALTRDNGLDTRRISAQTNWQRTDILPIGFELTTDAALRGDVYNTSSGLDPTDQKTKIDSGTTGRFIPMAATTLSYPMVRNRFGFTEMLIPKAQFAISPYGNEKNEIPNEDSGAFEFSTLNLFSFNRFPGYDRVEGGPRLNVGFDYNVDFNDNYKLDTTVGQVFRFNNDKNFASYTGLSQRQSDYVASAQLGLGKHLTFISGTRLNDDDFSINRLEFDAIGMYEKFRGFLSYLKLEEDTISALYGEQEGIGLGTSYDIHDNWRLMAGIRHDIQEDNLVEVQSGIIYHNECLVVDFGLGRSFIDDRDIDPGVQVSLKVQLLSFGAEEGVNNF